MRRDGLDVRMYAWEGEMSRAKAGKCRSGKGLLE